MQYVINNGVVDLTQYATKNRYMLVVTLSLVQKGHPPAFSMQYTVACWHLVVGTLSHSPHTVCNTQ